MKSVGEHILELLLTALTEEIKRTPQEGLLEEELFGFVEALEQKKVSEN
jgi:hypothetical protein